MTKIDIFSGFLGAGKTTLIKKLIKEAYSGEKLVLIENEFGDIGIDGAFMQEAGIQITELNSGCICCTLVGDFDKALRKVLKDFNPTRVLIEPSGVGKLSDIIKAVENVCDDNVKLNGFTTVVDAKKIKMYAKNFGEFFINQIEYANCIILSHTQNLSEEKLKEVVAIIRRHNKNATVVTTDWDTINGQRILNAIDHKNTVSEELKKMAREKADSDAEKHAEEHRLHSAHKESEHESGHHHHADDVFSTWGTETTKEYTTAQLEKILRQLAESDKYGTVLRAKGIVKDSENEEWIHFDYVPGEIDLRHGSADVIGKLCVIGVDVKSDELKHLFEQD
jgi:G3E family GTPase